MKLWLEAASSSDLDALLALECSSYSNPWTVDHFRAELRDPSRGRLLVLKEPALHRGSVGDVAGYAAFRVLLEEMELLNLTIAPQRRRHGLGRSLLSLVLRRGARRGARVVRLEVRESNGGALALYRAAGFRVTGRRREYYSRPPEDALLLERPLVLEMPSGAC